jgi:hypothetical protein
VRYNSPDLQMPPGADSRRRRLPTLNAGSRWELPTHAKARQCPVPTHGIASRGRSHWAFQHIHAPPVPAVKNIDWPRSDLDRLLLSKLESANLQPGARRPPRNTAATRHAGPHRTPANPC